MRRAPIKRKRANPRRRDAPRFERQQWDEASMKLFARSRGQCERCAERPPAERHHRKRRRDGGDELANLLFLCKPCHDEITDQPESVTRARALGYIVPALGVAESLTYPVLLWGTTWVLLDNDGSAVACDAPRHAAP